MSNEKDFTNIPPMEQRPRSERGIFFGFVAQADEPGQMDVVRWLRNDCRYRVVTILHDRDIHDEESVKKKRKAGTPDEELPHVGDTKAAHFHGIVRVGSKVTAQSLSKRFGGYLHFELLHDPAEYAAYMLHATFNARDKVQYKKSELQDDVALWEEISDTEKSGMDISSVVELVASYRSEDGQINVDEMLRNRDTLALRALMSHSYFYATFVNKNKNKEV